MTRTPSGKSALARTEMGPSLDLPANATRVDLLKAMQGRTRAKARTSGRIINRR